MHYLMREWVFEKWFRLIFVLIVKSISLLLIGVKGCVGVVRNMKLSKRDYCFFKRFERQARKELIITKDSNINDDKNKSESKRGY
jgi:hypothetical protein